MMKNTADFPWRKTVSNGVATKPIEYFWDLENPNCNLFLKVSF